MNRFYAFIALGLCVSLCGCKPKPQQQDGEIHLFEPGLISTEVVEYSPTFSPNGTELYFARSEGKWGQGNMKSSIFVAFKRNERWSDPVIAPFSGQYDDGDPHLSRDGKQLYFISKRPSSADSISADIWMVERNAEGNWGSPNRLPEPINSPHAEYGPRTDTHENLYFASNRPGGFGQGDLYIVEHVKGVWGEVKNMGPQINSPTGEWNLEVDPTGEMIIFEASQREQNISPYGDLYISFLSNGIWSSPQHLTELNTSGSDLFPFLTADGRLLYYTSSDSLKSIRTHIYRISFPPLLSVYKEKVGVLK